MQALSTKPYLIRAIHEWCMDGALTPYLLVAVDERTMVPRAYVKNGEIVLNVSYNATKDLQIGAETITFSARFGGEANYLNIPIRSVRGIYARENGQGMFFDVEPEGDDSEVIESENKILDQAPDDKKNQQKVKKPALKLVK